MILALESLLTLLANVRTQVLVDTIDMQRQLLQFLELFIAVRALVDAFLLHQHRHIHALAFLELGYRLIFGLVIQIQLTIRPSMLA